MLNTADRTSCPSATAVGSSAKNPLPPLSRSERILLESACIDIIAEFEQLLDLANAEREAGFLGESALIGNRMLHSLIDFAESYLSGRRLAMVYQLIDRGFQSTQKTIDLSSSQLWGPLRRLIGRQSASDLDVANSHNETGLVIAAAAMATIGGGICRLEDDAPVAMALYESLRPILIELRERW
jgi:hypothetical protein